MKHLKSIRSRLPDLYDFIQDQGRLQQPCVYIRLSPWHSPYYIGATDQDVLRREHSRCRKYLQLLRGQHAFFEPALHYWKRSNNYWLFCAVPIEIKLPTSFTSGFGDDYIQIYIGNCGLRCWTTSKHTIPLCIGWDLIPLRRFKPCVNFYRRLSLPLNFTISCGSPPLSTNRFAPRLRSFSPMTQLLLPPLHVRDWEAKLGTWLQRWVASHRGLFPSLFLPKIRVVETRSATLGDRIYNYRKWQRGWTPDTSFPCRCIDVDDRTTSRAHSHAVILDEFRCINTDIDSDIMTAPMKDQYFGDVNKL